MENIPGYENLLRAYEKLRGVVTRTPLLKSVQLNQIVGGRIFIKPEMLQHTGSFKFRGASNRITEVDRERFPGGVVACSSGNHAQGVAEAARLNGIAAAIVMPADAPTIKIERTRRSGAEVILYDRMNEDREEIARKICEERRADFIHPYDDPFIICGQGTLGLEVLEQLKKAGERPDMVLTPAGGGGMAAGVGLGVRELCPEAELYCVEPERFEDHKRSLEAGARLANDTNVPSICDALMAPMPGELTFALNRKQLTGGISVTDEEVCRAVAFAFDELKLVAEPGGVVTLAALLAGKIDVRGKTVAIVFSGGNVDSDSHAEYVKRGKQNG